MKTHIFIPLLTTCIVGFGCAHSKTSATANQPAPASSTATSSTLAASTLGTSAPTPPSSEVELSAEPSHHLAVENQYLRALKVDLAPSAATLKHRHAHDFVTITFGAAEISNEVDGKPPASVKLEDGQVRFTEGGGPAHLVRNMGQSPFRNVTVELLQAPAPSATSKWEEEHGVSSFKGGSREVLLTKGGVRVTKIDLKPGGALPKHELDAPHLVVAVSDLDLRDAAPGKAPHAVELKAGEVKWEDAGAAHKLMNKGKQDAKVVLLEFKP
jgi:quercetin dioxygenase-like cupin family protein